MSTNTPTPDEQAWAEAVQIYAEMLGGDTPTPKPPAAELVEEYAQLKSEVTEALKREADTPTPAFECRVCDYVSDEAGDTHTHPTPERVTLTAEERAAVSNALRRVAVDVCEHCGDLIISHDGEQWAHYRGPGSLLNRCQHTVPYGLDATPKHAGRYFPLAAREQALREEIAGNLRLAAFGGEIRDAQVVWDAAINLVARGGSR